MTSPSTASSPYQRIMLERLLKVEPSFKPMVALLRVVICQMLKAAPRLMLIDLPPKLPMAAAASKSSVPPVTSMSPGLRIGLLPTMTREPAPDLVSV